MVDKIAIILLNYNGYKDTITCIDSIKKSSISCEYSIIVVDNKSTNDSLEYLRKIKDVILIESKENRGFANGNNIGIKYALKNKYDYVLLLNNDTEICEDTIEKMYTKIKNDKSLGIVGARIMYFDNKNTINYCGGKVDWLSCTAKHYRINQTYSDEQTKFEYTDFITGCVMFIKSEVFEKVGYLPEEYFMYFEDVDFCVNVLNNGYKLGVCKDAIVYHKVSASSGGDQSPFSVKWSTRGRIIFMKKYKKLTKGILTVLFFYITRIIVGIIYLIKGKFNLVKAMNEGIVEGLKYNNQ